MAVKNKRDPIPLHPKLVENLQQALRARQAAERQIETILETARLSMNVPEDWVIRDAEVGFVPPPERPKPKVEPEEAEE